VAVSPFGGLPPLLPVFTASCSWAWAWDYGRRHPLPLHFAAPDGDAFGNLDRSVRFGFGQLQRQAGPEQLLDGRRCIGGGVAQAVNLGQGG
jgi:hypothetical protein